MTPFIVSPLLGPFLHFLPLSISPFVPKILHQAVIIRRGPIHGDDNQDSRWHYLIIVATQVSLRLHSVHMEDISIDRDMYVNKRKGVDVIQSSRFADNDGQAFLADRK